MNSLSAKETARNRWLSALSARDYDLLSPHLSDVDFERGSTFFDAGEDVSHVYFPTEGVVSLMTVLRGGASVETAAIGREGLVGVTCGPMNGHAVSRAVAQTDGSAICMDKGRFTAALAESAEMRRALSFYTESLFAQVQQTAACNAVHKLESRFARWLLTFEDRGGVNRRELTQEQLAEMLGVRRATVSEVSGSLDRRRLISRGRGHIEIIDRRGLERVACECYRTIRSLTNVLLDPHKTA